MLPWYPFYWGDYSRKTFDLTQGQHGAYMLFLRYVYTEGNSIPHKQRYSIARALTEQERTDADMILDRFFDRDGDAWVSDKVKLIIEDTENKHERRVNAGRKGGLNKSSNAKAKLEQCSTNHNHSIISKDIIPKGTEKKVRINGKRLSEWLKDEGHESLPRPWIDYAKNLGWDRGRVETVARAFRRYWDSPDAKRPVKRDWDTTWSNWCDRENERPGNNGRSKGYSLETVYDTAVADVYRSEGREERLKRLGIGHNSNGD